MSTRYFEQFGSINYNGRTVTNILSRASILEQVSTNPYAFYPYQLRENDRPDIIARQYYKDPFFSWLCYLSNNIVDPYYDWTLTDNQYNAMISSVYGSIDIANRRVINYRVNWDEDISVLSVASYNALPSYLMKYWTPQLDYNGNVNGYTRARLDWTVTTNYYQSLTISNSDTTFAIGDLVSTKLNGQIMSMAEVNSSNSTAVTLKHITGNPARMVQWTVSSETGPLAIGEQSIVSNSSVSIYGTVVASTNNIVVIATDGSYPTGNVQIVGSASAQTVTTVSNSNVSTVLSADYTGNVSSYTHSDVIAYCVQPEEAAYWSPFTAFEMEDESNTSKKSIRLLDASFSTQALLDLKNLMG